jgi:hypothetical protein
MTADVADLLARWKRLEADRRVWESHWQELAELLLPNRASFTGEQVAGARKTERIYDSVPMLARRGLASALDGLLKPKTSKWFTIRAADDELNGRDAAKAWLQEAEERMFQALYNRQARFIQKSGEADNDLVSFGTGILFTGEARGLNRLLFRAVALQDGFLAVNDEGDVDTLFVRSRLSARQAEQRYGRAALGPKTREALEANRPEQRFVFLQAVLPRAGRDPRKGDRLNLPFASLHIDVASQHLIGEGGFHEFPFAVPRWDTSADELYGRSPGMIALPDAGTLQAMGKTLLVAGQKAVDPPLIAVDDAVLGTPRSFPGGISYTDGEAWRELGGPPIRPLLTGADIPLGREMQNDTRDQIWAAFFRNVLQLPVAAPAMTATEILERKEEFIRTIGPVFGRLESDYIGQVVERVFNIMKRAGAFPEPPEILAGREIRFDFVSPVQQARKQIEAAGAARSIELLAPFIQADPEIMDNFDGDAIARDVPDIFGTPIKWLRSRERVEEMRQGRAQAEQAGALAAGAEQLAGQADPDQLAALAEQIGGSLGG